MCQNNRVGTVVALLKINMVGVCEQNYCFCGVFFTFKKEKMHPDMVMDAIIKILSELNHEVRS